MGAVDDLRLLGGPVDDPVAAVTFLSRLPFPKSELLVRIRLFLEEKGLPVTSQFRAAAGVLGAEL